MLLYWGGLDLNHTRFNGRPLEPPPDAPPWFAYGEDAENIAFGFWPGSREAPYPVLYAYGTPAPDAIADAAVAPEAARWEPQVGEFVLPYDAVRSAPDPEGAGLSSSRASTTLTLA